MNSRQMSVCLRTNDTIMTKNIGRIFGTGKINSRIDFIYISREGVSMAILKKIMEYTALTLQELSTILPVSERQLSRYGDKHLLRKDISSHLIQIVELFERGYEVFGEKSKFRNWLRTENRILGNIRPIEILDTPIGIEMIKDILGRIEHGVYS